MTNLPVPAFSVQPRRVWHRQNGKQGRWRPHFPILAQPLDGRRDLVPGCEDTYAAIAALLT